MDLIEKCLWTTLTLESRQSFDEFLSHMSILRVSRNQKPRLVQIQRDSAGKQIVKTKNSLCSDFVVTDSPTDCPEYLCFSVLSEYGETSDVLDPALRLYKEVMVHDGIREKSTTIERLAAVKGLNPKAFCRSHLFIFSIKKNRRVLWTYNWHPQLVKK